MAYRRIGRLLVGYDADTSGFRRGTREVRDGVRDMRRQMARLRQSLRRVSRAFADSARRMVSFRNVVVSIAGGGGLGLFISRTADAGAQLFEMSARVGIASDRLQLLQRVFEGDGVAADKATRSLQNFTRYANEAAGGVKSYEETFDRLGVRLRDTDGNLRPVNDLILDAADGFANLSSQSERVALAVELFGARNAAMLNVLQRGRSELEGSIEQFRRLGTWSDRTAAELKVLSQAFTDSGNAWRTAFGNAIARAGPQLYAVLEASIELSQAFADRLVGAIVWVIDHFDQIVRGLKIAGIAMIAMSRPVGVLGTALVALARGMVTAGGAAVVLRGALAGVVATARVLGRVLLVGIIIEAIIVAVQHAEKFREVFVGIGAAVGHLGTIMDGWVASVQLGWADLRATILNAIVGISNDFIDKMNAAIERVRSAMAELFGEWIAIPDKIEIPRIETTFRIDDLQSLQERIAEGDQAAQDLRETVSKIGDDLIEIGRAWAAGWGLIDDDLDEWGNEFDDAEASMSRFEEEVQKLLDSLGKLGDAAPPVIDKVKEKTKEAAKEISEAQRAIERVSEQIGSAFGQTVEDIITGARDAGDALKELVREIVRAVLRAAVINPIAGAVTQGIQSFIGGISLPGGTGPGSGRGGAGPAGVYAERSIPLSQVISGRAAGGPVATGRPYVVGERGPELFVPSGDGAIVPNRALAATAGEQTVINFSPVIQSSDPTLVRAELRRTLPVFAEVVESRILQKQARPSAHRQAIINT